MLNKKGINYEFVFKFKLPPICFPNRNSGVVVPMEQLFMEYNARHNVMFGTESNNYVMRPMGEAHTVGDMVKLDVITGPYVKETVQSFYK